MLFRSASSITVAELDSHLWLGQIQHVSCPRGRCHHYVFACWHSYEHFCLKSLASTHIATSAKSNVHFAASCTKHEHWRLLASSITVAEFDSHLWLGQIQHVSCLRGRCHHYVFACWHSYEHFCLKSLASTHRFVSLACWCSLALEHTRATLHYLNSW